jgi:hypothetical protein
MVQQRRRMVHHAGRAQQPTTQAARQILLPLLSLRCHQRLHCCSLGLMMHGSCSMRMTWWWQHTRKLLPRCHLLLHRKMQPCPLNSACVTSGRRLHAAAGSKGVSRQLMLMWVSASIRRRHSQLGRAVTATHATDKWQRHRRICLRYCMCARACVGAGMCA